MAANHTRLYADVQFLTELQPARNYRNLASLNQAPNYIQAALRQAGGQPQDQVFRVDGQKYRNVIASYGPPDAPRLVVGAHYDVCGDQPGADDNASAVAGLLETARLLHEQRPALCYRLDLVAYCLEEPPYFATDNMGSAVHAKSLQEAGVVVWAMICYEMIGYFSDVPGSQNWRHYIPIPAITH
ncbi:M28 family peptidase [Hymenobacter defluvii]|uniref:M28 family peptidase n=1 Tax=Hymenobacter defluvii TaxID=2054411 RepID=UPI001FB932AF|nr:M28 family peptidase [Hymenobacter defluvii]